MRLRISDRILVAIAGIILLAGCAAIVAQMFFGVDLLGFATHVFTSDSPRARIALIGTAVFLLLLGFYCLFVLFRHRKRKDKFILQKNDGGELAISVKALENMVNKCIAQHEELTVQHLYLENRKDGLLIRMRAAVAGGVSIPLTVESLQKQIRQYVTACSGVEVKGIRVQIDSSGEDAENAPFAIAAPASKPLLREGEQPPAQLPEAKTEEPVREEAPATAPTPAPAPAPVHAPAPMPVPVDEEDDRPLHQRLFSTQPEPCFVPEPPAAAEPAQAEPEAVTAEPAEAENPAEEEIAPETQEDVIEVIPEAEAEDVFAPSVEDSEEEGVSLEGADPDFLESLKAFDEAITGEEEEAE